jgi:hypothetical protein
MRLRERYGITGSLRLAEQVAYAIETGAGYGPIRSDIQYDEHMGLDWYYVRIGTGRKQEPALVLVGYHRIMKCPTTCLMHTKDWVTYQAGVAARNAGLVPVERIVVKRRIMA